MPLKDYQAAFAARIRDPRHASLPVGASASRMRIYRDVLLSNLEGFLLAGYPVTRKILGQRSWRRLVRRFFAEHRCRSPLFRDIAEAFLDWVRASSESVNAHGPFVTDLMEYEWLELAVSVDPREADMERIDPDGDLLAGAPALQPSTRLASYRWAVHRIGPRFRPRAVDAVPHHYLLFRDAGNEVRFIRLNPMSAALVALIQVQPGPGGQLVDRLAGLARVVDRGTFARAGLELLTRLRQQGAILGTWRDP